MEHLSMVGSFAVCGLAQVVTVHSALWSWAIVNVPVLLHLLPQSASYQAVQHQQGITNYTTPAIPISFH
jgi:hypothetical protein